jgi:hypothetical protein
VRGRTSKLAGARPKTATPGEKPTHEDPSELGALRAQAIAVVQEAFEADLIEVDELESRLELAKTSSSRFELEGLIARSAPPRPAPAEPSRAAARLPGRGTALAILGSSRKTGRWQVPRTLTAVAALGSVTLDFRDASLGEHTTLRAFAAMGSVEIIVPPEVTLEADGIGILGAFGDSAGASAAGPRVRVTGVALLGAVEVTVRAADGSLIHELWRRTRRALRR